MTTPAQRRQAYFAWGAICLIWGTTYLAIKIALDTVPPFLMGGLRYISAGLVLVAILRAQGKTMPDWRALAGFFLSGTLLLGFGNGGVVWAEMFVPSGLAAVMVAAVPFWMVGLEALLPGGERLTRRAIAGLLVGFTGIVLLVWPDLRFDASSGWSFAAGVFALQLACCGWALGSSFSRRRGGKVDPTTGAAFQMLFGGIVMAVAGTITGEWSALSFTPRTFGALAYLSIMGSLVGFVAYIYALTHLPTTFVSLYAYVNPVVAVALGTLILHEPFGWRLVAAIAIILTGMGIVSSKRPAARQESAPPARTPSTESREATAGDRDTASSAA
jgi:drug/metabolite transporter (DMT)-like permease